MARSGSKPPVTAINNLVIIPATRLRANFWYGYLVASVVACIGILAYYFWRLN